MKKICHDLFNISGRLKNIDKEYEVFRNTENDRFEVYWRGKFAFVVPFDFLDERTLFYTKKTRRENADEIERGINESNEKIAKEKEHNIQILKSKIKDYVNYEYKRFN